MSQARLFEVPEVPLNPPGFSYQPEFITKDEEQTLLREFERVPLHKFQWDGYDSKRRVKGYTQESGMPAPLIKILERVAKFAKVQLEKIDHLLISEYISGTGIGWHRDKGAYDKIIGLSLGSAAQFRLRKVGPWTNKRKWERFSATAEPRSLYIMSGETRTLWQHSVAPVKDLRYSITMRTGGSN